MSEDLVSQIHQTKRFKWRWLFCALFLLVYLPQVPGCMTSHAPKYGRVIDASTGKGMEGVAVITTTRVVTPPSGFIGYPEVRSSDTLLSTVIGITDSDGNYYLPGSWLQLDLANFLPFLGSWEQRWELYAMKPGYVMGSDEAAWRELNSYGDPKIPKFTAQFIRPEIALWLGFSIKMSPITLVQENMSLKEASWYYRVLRSGYIFLTAGGWGQENESRILKTQFYNYYLSKICTMDENELIPFGPYFSNFFDAWEGKRAGANPHNYFNNLYTLEPNKFQTGAYTNPFPMEGALFKSTDVCAAMKKSGVMP